MNVDVRKLQDKLCEVMCADIRLVARNDRVAIRTPFRFPDGDPYILYLEERPNGWLRVTDAGHTLMHLSYENDVDKFRQGPRGKLFEQVLSGGDVSIEEGELYMDVQPTAIGSAVMRFGQTLTSVTDLTFLNRARSESTFYEDLAEALERIVSPDRITKDYLYPDMPNGEDYPIDYRIEGKAAPLFLFGVPGRDKARLATIVLERLLRANAEFDSVLIFADQSTIPRSDLARLSNAGGEMIASLDAEEDLRRKISRRAA